MHLATPFTFLCRILHTPIGIVFSSSGSFKNACDYLSEKASKAFYMLKQIQPHNNVMAALSLFDTLVLPIISYGSVVWGPIYAQKASLTNFMSICNDSPAEKLNIKLCKYLLGVHRKSTNDAVRGELGRYPLLIKILNYSHRYFKKLEDLPAHSLVKISYSDLDLSSLNSSWYNSINRLINIFNQSRSFNHDMQNVYRMSWTESLQSCTGKLRTYSKFKKTIYTRKLYHPISFARKKKSF